MSKVHRSTSEQGARIIFLASSMVFPVKGDRESEGTVSLAREQQVECADCGLVFPATTFDGNHFCPTCWDDAGMENEHNDGWHEIANADCKACREQ